jgi:hypothetical protein
MALTSTARNDWFWTLGAARLKLTPRLTIGGEVALPLWKGAFQESSPLPGHQLPWSVTTEIETGGHVFQLGLTNGAGLSENQVLLTTYPLLRLGFNISRIFSFQPGLTYGTSSD